MLKIAEITILANNCCSYYYFKIFSSPPPQNLWRHRMLSKQWGQETKIIVWRSYSKNKMVIHILCKLLAPSLIPQSLSWTPVSWSSQYFQWGGFEKAPFKISFFLKNLKSRSQNIQWGKSTSYKKIRTTFYRTKILEKVEKKPNNICNFKQFSQK